MKVVQATSTSNLPTLIADLVARTLQDSRAPAGSEWLDVLTALGTVPGIEAVDRLRYRQQEYEIRVGRLQQLEVTTSALAKLAPLSLVVAPEVVASLPAGADHGVLITRYSACGGEQLRDVSTAQQPLRDAAVAQLRRDMETLVAHGLVHPYVRGTEHWLVSSERGTLVLDDWYALQPCTPEEGAAALAQIEWAAQRHQAQFPKQPANAGERSNRVRQIFGVERVLLPVIHPVGWDAALANVALVVDVGCPGVFLIDQGMSQAEVLELVLEIRKRFPKLWVGVNLLSLSPAAALTTALDACEGRIDGLWTDNAGVDEHAASQPEAQALLEVRRARGWDGLYFGGVAFKYQREVSDSDLARAIRAAMPFMDVVCTSGPATGRAARVDKLRAMRDAVGPELALALASGVNAVNVLDYAPYVNAFLVGTGIETSFGVLDRQKVATLQQLVSRSGTLPARGAEPNTTDASMPNAEIPTHELDAPDIERILRRTEKKIAGGLEHLARIPDNLGAAFDDAKVLLGLRRTLGRPNAEVLDALRLICDIGVALFQRALVDRSASVTLSIAGKDIQVPGGNSYYNSAPRWAEAAAAAMTLRDAQALARLCAFDTNVFGGSYDTFHDRYVEAVMAFVSGSGDWSERLRAASVAAENAELFPERGRRIGVPLIAVARAVLEGDEAAFNQQLEQGLIWYRTLYSRPPDNADAGGVVALRYLGWCARAHDNGLKLAVKSDYIPSWLVEGAFPAP